MSENKDKEVKKIDEIIDPKTGQAKKTSVEKPVIIDRPVETDFVLENPEDDSIIVDPATGFKARKVDDNGCPPGFTWNEKWGRCLEDKVEPKKQALNKEDDQEKPF